MAFLLDDHESVCRDVHETPSVEPGTAADARVRIPASGRSVAGSPGGSERLRPAEKTIKNYVSSPLSALGMRHRSRAVAHAARTQVEKSESNGNL